jgi:conjugal transfer pilin signal peptidase TrbI
MTASNTSKVKTEKQTLTNKEFAIGMAKSLFAVILCFSAIQLFSAKYSFGYDGTTGEHCLPYTLFIIDKQDKQLDRHNLFAFYSKNMNPYYPNGTIVVKELAGIPGDRVVVNEGKVYVEGKLRGDLPHVKKLKKKNSDYQRDELVPAGKYWAMGTLPKSYDSRYWGYVDSERQVIGKAYPIF